MRQASADSINLRTSLTLRDAFFFPLQNKESKKEIIIGGLWMFVPVVGWILNMGHRIAFVRKMQSGKKPFPSWNEYKILMKDGLVTLLGMLYYTSPGLLLILLGYFQQSTILYVLGGILFLMAVIVIPGYMTKYCFNKSIADIFKVKLVYQSITTIGKMYWKAWAIALAALAVSFSGLIVFGVGFLFTSVWFWQVAGYCFANIFTERYQLENPNYNNLKSPH